MPNNGLLKKQKDVSEFTPMPVDNMSDSQHWLAITGETVQLYYYNSGVLTIDAGQVAGVAVKAKLTQGGVLDDIGSRIGSSNSSSFSFVTGTILTTEVALPWEVLEAADDATGTGQLAAIVANFTNGQYAIDYRTGTVYGKKATTGVSDTAGYKVSMTTSGGSSTLPSDVDIVKIGGNATEEDNGRLTVGSIRGVEPEYKSPADFTATYTSTTTLTLAGTSFTITNAELLYVKVTTSAGVADYYWNGINGVSMTISSDVITIAGAGTPFASGDVYEVGVSGQRKPYDPSTTADKTAEIAPLSGQIVAEPLVDTTNVSAATVYYPSSTGASIDGYKDLSFSGKFIDADGTVTMTVEMMNDEDTTSGDWIQVYGYDDKNNVTTNSWAVTNGTLTFANSFNNGNYRYYRVKVIYSGSTNTAIIKQRKKAL